MRILTGNDLVTGQVTWWTGAGWSIHVADAVDVGAHADTILAVEQAARRVNTAYAVDAEQGPEGVRPLHIKERIRAEGPTVRPDLAVKPASVDEREWVI
jgi:hypothetical protein